MQLYQFEKIYGQMEREFGKIKKGEEEVFVCGCGHKEKLSAFKARREKEGAGVSKKDVQNYLRKQKEEPVNTAFADAFSKIKL